MSIKEITLKLGLVSLLLLMAVGCSTDPDSNSNPLASDTPHIRYARHLDHPLPLIKSSDNNLWIMLGKSMRLDHYPDEPAVQEQIQWYMAHTDYLERTANRASPYVYYILQQIKLRNMPAEIGLLPIIESGYNPFAHSGAGASGLWQIMPSTGLGFNLRANWWYDGRRDFYNATPAALDYLQYLSTLFHGDWLLAIAAYNSGEGTVNAAIRYNQRHARPTDFWDLKLPEQTREYVPNLLALAIIMGDPKKYPINWPDTKVEPAIGAVYLDSQIDLDKAAQLADISVEEIYYLNPGYTRWATDPHGDHQLILPANKIDEFNKNLASLPKADRVTWHTYEVKAKDTLEKIAKKFRTTPKVIQQINNMKTRTVHPGSTLLLPKASATPDVTNSTSASQYAWANRTVAPPEPLTYTVRAHDTLKSIARQHRVDIRNLMFWNQLKATDKLEPGRTLIISPRTRSKTLYLDGTAPKPAPKPAKVTTPTPLVPKKADEVPPLLLRRPQ